MPRLPVIAGFGGVNAAGRSSFHYGFRRLVFDAINEKKQQQTIVALQQMMGSVDKADALTVQQVLNGTLIRKIEASLFDVERVGFHEPISVDIDNDNLRFTVKRKALPSEIPANWALRQTKANEFEVTVSGNQDCLVETHRALKVSSAGQMPSGFDPGEHYNSRNHPRGLQMSVYALSDALGSMGVSWDQLRQAIAPDQLSVYAGSAMSQLDMDANGGMLAARFLGKRTSSKQCPFGFAEMPADFANAYALGGMGTTGTNMGACASFLYNLRQGIQDIQRGSARVAIVGGSEAPITPDIINGYAAMSALASDAELAELDGGVLNQRRACRPFGLNCGFTLGESSQYVILLDDELALELGANIHGAVTDVFINADGYKKSISAPGAGNYLTIARALASVRGLLGDKQLGEKSFVLAHGTGTPQNRVTESDVLDRVAASFDMQDWPVVAVKAFLGHSIGCAGGDQLAASLGIWAEGVLPGIETIDAVADDVKQDHLQFNIHHKTVDPLQYQAAVINAKGFGGNNASACIVSPALTEDLLRGRAGKKQWANYLEKRESVQEASLRYDEQVLSGSSEPYYYFDNNVLGADDLSISAQSIAVSTFGQPVNLACESPYRSWLTD